jgi:phosphoglycolate phosphatase-like HAD superfamily hydrolase
MPEIIFFDFDGVIVESVDIKTRAFYQLFEIEGEDVARRVVDYHLKNAGVSRYDKFRYIYREILSRPLKEEEFYMLCDRFAGIVMENVVRAPYVKGAEEFLENYAADYKCFIVSATPQEEIEEIIYRRRIGHFFKAVYGAPAKKNDVVRDSIVRENTDSCNAVYVGDAMSDYLAAKENKVAFIARLTNDNSRIFKDLDCLKLNDLMNLKESISSVHCHKGKSLD